MMINFASTPIRLQRHPAECGSVCLGIIVEWFGDNHSNSKLRGLCGIGRDGANVKQIQKGANLLGYELRILKKGINTLKNQTSPLIIHWNLNHFVVFEGIKNDIVYLNDPAAGKRNISLEEFKNHFTGICIEILKSTEIKKQNESQNHQSYFLPLLWHLSFKFLLVPAFVFLTIELFYAGLFNAYYDYAVANELSVWVGVIAFIGLTLVAFKYIFSNEIEKLKLHLVQDIDFRLNTFLTTKLINKSITFFESHYDGEISFRLMQLRAVSTNLVSLFFYAVESVLFLFISLLLILFINPPLFFVLFVPNILLIAYWYRIQNKIKELHIKKETAKGKLNSSLNQRFMDIDRFQAMGLQSTLFPPLKSENINLEREQFQYENFLSIYKSLAQVLDSVTLPLVLFASSYLLLVKELTFGAYAFTYVLGLAAIPRLKKLHSKFDAYLQTKSLANDADDFFCDDNNSNLEVPMSITEEKIDKKAQFQACDLGYSFNGSQNYIFRGINLSIYQGDIICFIGESGSGKTTLLEVISGQRKPSQGDMLFEQSSAYHAVKSSFVFCDEDVSGTIREFFHADQASDWEKVSEALELVGLEVKCSLELEKGGLTSDFLDTFSVGEKQRVSLARAYCFNSDVIFFDEAFSHVDFETSLTILQRLKMSNTTLIMSTHRPEIQEQSDRKFIVNS